MQYKNINDKKINFEEVDLIDINAWILRWNNLDWMYDLSDNINLDSIKSLEKKYNESIKFFDKKWKYNINKIIEKFDKENLLKLVKYAKKIFISIFWDEYWNKAYKNFLEYKIITNHIFYNKIIKKDNFLIKYFHSELKNIFKYYENRWDKVWFAVDALYWYRLNSDKNKDIELDNKWEPSRYHYWRKYKENWESKEKK